MVLFSTLTSVSCFSIIFFLHLFQHTTFSKTGKRFYSQPTTKNVKAQHGLKALTQIRENQLLASSNKYVLLLMADL